MTIFNNKLTFDLGSTQAFKMKSCYICKFDTVLLTNRPWVILTNIMKYLDIFGLGKCEIHFYMTLCIKIDKKEVVYIFSNIK